MANISSNLSSDQSRLAILVAAGVGIVSAAGFAYWYRKYLQDIPPKQWRRVGELVDVICYPIKSCAGIRLKTVGCSNIGLENGYLRDRIFMVVTANGEFITARQYPKFVLIQPKIENNIMKLSGPGMIDIEVDIEKLQKTTSSKTKVWGQVVDTIDCGDEVAKWFSRFILSEDSGLRLVYYASNKPTRDVREYNKIFDTTFAKDTGALHDATSFMLFNESSMADLNSRLDNSVSPLNFRPNFIVRGPLAYEENEWKWVKIGDVVFRNVKPCTRCIFTNINPETGMRSPDGNPLKKLKEFRLFPKTGNSPVLGTHLGIRVSGKVSVGDAVFVEDK